MNFRNKLLAPITTVPAALQNAHFASLDGLRGIAVLIVVFAHLGGNHLLKPFHLSVNSRTGVDLFFVLSGFLITSILLKERVAKGSVSLQRFYIRRIFRIVPAAYAFLFLVCLLNLFLPLHIGLRDFLASLFFLKNLPMPNEPFTAHFWSLAVEVQFYIIFPFLLVTNINRYIIIALTLVIGITVIAICAEHISITAQYPEIRWLVKLSRYAFWKGPVIILIGSLLSILMFKGIINIKAISKPDLIAALLIMMALVITANSFVSYTRYLSEIVAALLFAITILISLKGGCFLSSTFLVKVGVMSYSIYIWQELFIGTHAWQPWLKFMAGYPVAELIIIKLVLLAALSFLSYYFIERVFLRIKTKFE
ncbi:acyltransferase [Mucilaginibacter sp. dw_454]|uniref:acyltransferase family protein n=1 Tax=Mucilaginibacter sp. dw_454 TaxID=2720079 RepID=UPI001BD1F1BD|nr:acyltransferase [Mucilaginibacter sp. dw_454]